MALKDIKIEAEYLDVLDEVGKPIGIKKLKDDVHRDGDWHATIHVWTMNSNGQFLMQQRSATKESTPNAWDNSCAGHILAGETSDFAVLREYEEELGVRIEPKDISLMFTHTIKNVEHDGKYINNQINYNFLVKKDLEIESLKLDPKEVAQVRWFEFTELMDHAEKETLLLNYTKENLKDILNKLKEFAKIKD